MLHYIFTDSLFIRGALATTLIASMNAFVDFFSPLVGFLALVVGLIVGVMTIWKYAIEIKIKTRELNNKK